MTAHALLFTLAAIGISETWYLIKKRKAGEQPVCVIGGGECHLVLDSKYNKTLGIHNDLLGFLFYVGMAVLTAFLVLEVEPLVTWELLAKIIIGVGTLMSLYFIFLQKYVIKAWCFWCLMSAFTIFSMQIIVLATPLIR